MSNLKALIDYQITDEKLMAIEKELAQTEERKKYAQARKFLKNAQTTLEGYETKAISLREQLKQLASSYEKLIAQLTDFADIDYEALSDSEEEVAYLKKQAQAMEESLKAIKKDLSTVKAKIEEVSKQYKELKKQTISAQKQYKEFKEKYQALEDAKSKEMNGIKAKLAEIEKDIPQEVLEKYKNKRKEGVWPIMGELKGDNCPICRMEFTKAAISSLTSSGIIECENCHRLIYKS